jgi:hypothetical protein
MHNVDGDSVVAAVSEEKQIRLFVQDLKHGDSIR